MVPTSAPEGAEDGVEEARPGGRAMVLGAREVVPAHYRLLPKEREREEGKWVKGRMKGKRGGRETKRS